MGLPESMKALDASMSTYGAAREKCVPALPVLADITVALAKAKSQKEFDKVKAAAVKKYKDAAPLLDKAESTAAAVTEKYNDCCHDIYKELESINDLLEQYAPVRIEITKLNKRIVQYNKDTKYNPFADVLKTHPDPDVDALYKGQTDWNKKVNALFLDRAKWESACKRCFPPFQSRLKEESASLGKMKYPLKSLKKK